MRQIQVCCVSLFFVCISSAQRSWFPQEPGSSFRVEYIAPTFTDLGFISYSGGVMVASVRLQSSEETYFVAELPFAWTTIRYSFIGINPLTGGFDMKTSGASSSSLVNVTIGLESVSAVSTGRFRVTLPLVKENSNAVGAGILGDYPNLDRYLPKTIVLSGGYMYHPAVAEGFHVLVGVNPAVWIPMRGQGSSAELLLDYGGGAALSRSWLSVGLIMEGRTVLTGGGFGAGNFRHHLSIQADITVGSFRPGMLVRIPVERDFSGAVTSTLGFRLGVLF